MPPKTSISKEQIVNILAAHGLETDVPVRRLEAGFTNEVHEAGGYILKICVRQGFEERFDTEAKLLKQLYPDVLVPQLVAADKSCRLIDKPFMIYKKVAGRPLGHIWHELSDDQRRQLVDDICWQIKLIADSHPDPGFPDGMSWQQVCAKSLADNLEPVKRQKLLAPEQTKKVEGFISSSIGIMQTEKPTFLYWDVHLDNFIVDDTAHLAAIIDLEHVGVFSLDYLLNVVRRTQRYPRLTLAPEMEKFARSEDYSHLMDWYHEAWPELFDFPALEKRLDTYELDDILRHMPRFPEAAQLYERLGRILR